VSRLRATEPIEVDLGPCECPNTPHAEGDKAWLRPRLTIDGGLRASWAMLEATDRDETWASLSMVYLADGLVRWNLLDDAGLPIPITEDVLRSGALDWETTLSPIAERANVLYTDSVINPLRKGRKAPLQSGQTTVSTSATTDSSPPSPTPSEPSTTPTTPPSQPTGTLTAIGSSI
jgi:hypothetical protein